MGWLWDIFGLDESIESCQVIVQRLRIWVQINDQTSEVTEISRKPGKCYIRLGGVTLRQMEKFKYHRGVSVEWWERDGEVLENPTW